MTKTGFLIMRAQPLHTGHRDLIRQAKSQCDNLVLLLGSANSPRTIKNPFTYIERKARITQVLKHEFSMDSGIVIYPLNDYKYSDTQWLSDVDSIVSGFQTPTNEVVLFGHAKEGNTYLDWFPQYRFINIETIYEINATQVRAEWFKNQRHNFETVVLEDFDYFEKEKVVFGGYPFPETLNFNCGDAVVECAGQILLIQRKRAPGRGTWALPGGFKNNNETFVDCAIRELVEEANVRIPEKILRGSIVGTRLFDSPTRGMGIARSTLAVHIRVSLNADGSMPRVTPMDDAFEADWFPIKIIMNDMELFDDHSDIISTMCNVSRIPAHLNPRFQ